MSCPTCDHTMQCITHDAASLSAHYWCPRCGTLTAKVGDFTKTETPGLVARCREFEKAIPGNVVGEMKEWKRLGIAESINRPEDRPT